MLEGFNGVEDVLYLQDSLGPLDARRWCNLCKACLYLKKACRYSYFFLFCYF